MVRGRGRDLCSQEGKIATQKGTHTQNVPGMRTELDTHARARARTHTHTQKPLTQGVGKGSEDLGWGDTMRTVRGQRAP